MSSEPAQELCAPWACRGFSEFVHLSCLQQWRDAVTHKGKPEQLWKTRCCYVCREPYALEVLNKLSPHTRRQGSALRSLASRVLSPSRNSVAPVWSLG